MHNGTERVLLIDDNNYELERTLTTLREVAPNLMVQSVESATLALEAAREVPPELILIDLDDLGQHGLDFIAILRADETLSVIPVIVLSHQTTDTHLWNAYRARANAFIVKPADSNALRRDLETLCDFWFRVNKLPVISGGAIL